MFLVNTQKVLRSYMKHSHMFSCVHDLERNYNMSEMLRDKQDYLERKGNI